jgi:16S rRNA (guanine527-N7)-methyltransferase
MSGNQPLQAAIEQGIKALELQGPAGLAPRLERFLHSLVKWNKVYNLTSIRDPQAMVALHLLDSLALVPFLAALQTENTHSTAPIQVLDVGSGAGLPGIPLAMYYPQLEFVLLDSNGKKTRFLQQMQIELGLNNVKVVQSRVEDYTGQFKLIMCRAFANLADISQGLQHLLAQDGSLLAMKGKQEFNDPQQSALQVGQVHTLQVPGIEAERHLYILTRPLNNHRDVQPS